jgi:hypothetical protein
MRPRPGPEHIGTTGASDGDALLYDAEVDEYVPGPLPASGVESITAGANVRVNSTDPAHPIVSALVPLTTVVGGVPEPVWDADNQLVLTEAPS